MLKKKKLGWKKPPRRTNSTKPAEVTVEHPYGPETPVYIPIKRTPEMFVHDMLADGDKEWPDIMAVARQVRKGIWYDDVRKILQKRRLMPTDQEKINKARDVVHKKAASHVPSRSKPKGPRPALSSPPF